MQGKLVEAPPSFPQPGGARNMVYGQVEQRCLCPELKEYCLTASHCLKANGSKSHRVPVGAQTPAKPLGTASVS